MGDALSSLSDETSSTSSRSSVTSHSYEVPAPPSDVRPKLDIFFLYLVCFGFQPRSRLQSYLCADLRFFFSCAVLAWRIDFAEPRGGRDLLA